MKKLNSKIENLQSNLERAKEGIDLTKTQARAVYRSIVIVEVHDTIMKIIFEDIARFISSSKHLQTYVANWYSQKEKYTFTISMSKMIKFLEFAIENFTEIDMSQMPREIKKIKKYFDDTHEARNIVSHSNFLYVGSIPGFSNGAEVSRNFDEFLKLILQLINKNYEKVKKLDFVWN